jgi:hypothetical protein
MSKIMSLEGPRLSPLDRLRTRFAGVGEVYTFHPEAIQALVPSGSSSGLLAFVGVLGAVAGGWLAGTPSGQSFVRRIRGK